jgi:hypothetical protein
VALELIVDSHEWKLDGASILGVTETLKLAGIIEYPFVPAEYLERGRLVHNMIHAWFDRDLKLPVPEWLAPYKEGVENFVAETGFDALYWEVKMHSVTHRYAGMCDAIGTMRGQKLPVIVDWKTGHVDSWVALQTAAYVQMVPQKHAKLGQLYHRIGVQIAPNLHKGRNYSCTHFPITTLPMDTQVFNHAHAVAKWKKAA